MRLTGTPAEVALGIGVAKGVGGMLKRSGADDAFRHTPAAAPRRNTSTHTRPRRASTSGK